MREAGVGRTGAWRPGPLCPACRPQSPADIVFFRKGRKKEL